MKKFLICSVIGLGFLLSGCSGEADVQSASASAAALSASSDNVSQSTELFAMDTVMTLTAYGSQAAAALDAGAAEIDRLDALFSISSASGDILSLNQNGTGTVSDDTAALLSRALEVSNLTDGLFDCTIAPIMEAWGFPSGNYRVPQVDELTHLLEKVDYQQVSLAPSGQVTLASGTAIDLGGIAKGYTSDRLMQVFADNGVTSGIVSLGGNVQTLGHKPDGSLWHIAIQDPFDTTQTFAVVDVADKAVITSGGYQRYFDQGDTRYHHIIDPRTGYPADSGLVSVTIVSADGTLADGLSTALFIMGRDAAVSFWQQHPDAFDAVLVEENGTVTITEGLEGLFTLTGGGTPEVVYA